MANVPPNCFMPRPKVGSAVIRLTRHEVMPVETKDEKLMFSIIRASFNQRRKTLANGLKNSELLHFSKEEIEAAITACGWPLTIRGEALNLQEFARLTDELCNRGDASPSPVRPCVIRMAAVEKREKGMKKAPLAKQCFLSFLFLKEGEPIF